jgi:uncharacterized protein YdiU (UPF0061 family)
VAHVSCGGAETVGKASARPDGPRALLLVAPALEYAPGSRRSPRRCCRFWASDEDKAIAAANESLKAFDSLYQVAYAAGMGRKLGFARSRDGDQALIQDLHRMADYQADFTATFRPLCEASTDPSRDADVRALVSDPAAYDAWAPGWRARLAQEDDAPESRRTRMRSVNPAFIPRNHRIEAAIRDAEVGRYDTFHELNNVLARPYEDQPQSARYTQPPAPHEEVLQTFCGT